jgi:hypothetical protein
LDALEAAIAAGGIRIERKDRIARDDKSPAQRAERGVARRPMGRACERRERLDLVAVVLQRRALATQAQRRLENPFAALVPDGGFSADR